MPETNAAFALSAEEEKEFAAMAGGDAAPEQDDFEDIAARDPDAAADIASTEAEEEGDEDAQWKKDRKVPFKVFDAERRRGRAAEAERQKLQQEYATARERLNMLMAVVEGRSGQQQTGQQPAAPQQPQVPDWSKLKQSVQEDVFTSVEGTIDRVQQLEQQLQRQQQEIQQRAFREQVAQTHLQAEAAVKAQVPDYDDAIAHLKTARFQQLRLMGWQDQQAADQVHREAFDFVAQQIQRNINPAVAAYQYALAMGYTPKQARQQAADATGQEVEPARDAQGRFVAQRDPKLDQIAASQARNKSLSGAGGGAGQKMSAFERVMAMDDKAFKKFVDKGVDREEWFRIMNS